MKPSKEVIKKIVDKMDAEIMDWVYEIIEVNFDTVMVQDSSELRDILKKNISSALQQQREEILDKVEAKFVDSSWIIGECELWEVFTKSKWNKFKKSL